MNSATGGASRLWLETQDEVLRRPPLVQDYLFNFARVASRFPYDPYDEASFAARAGRLSRTYRGDRELLVRGLAETNRRAGAGDATLANLARLREPGTLAVVTGQQAGVFTGPLYTVYKAVAAVQLARHYARVLGRAVVPVFWIAAEDHDYGEVNHIDLVTPEGELRRLTLEEEPRGRCSIGHFTLGDAGLRATRALFELLPATEFREEVRERALWAAEPGQTLADWFARLMAWLFQDAGLVLANPLEPPLRRMAAEFFGRILAAGGVAVRAAEGRARLEELGYAPTLDVDPAFTGLYLYRDGVRWPVLGEGGRFSLRDRPEGFDLPTLEALAAGSPEVFSCNVVTRPMAQEHIFPTLAYVGGPGEISYLAQCREAFEAFDLELPIVYPRASLTVVEPTQARYLRRQGLSVADVAHRLQERRQACLKRLDDLGLDELFTSLQRDVRDRHAEVAKALASLDPALSRAAEQNWQRIQLQLKWLADKARQHHRQRCEVSMRQYDRLAVSLYPRGQPQERVLNVLPLLVKFGPRLVAELLSLDLLTDRCHRLLYT